jgi:hypothetical protein
LEPYRHASPRPAKELVVEASGIPLWFAAHAVVLFFLAVAAWSSAGPNSPAAWMGALVGVAFGLLFGHRLVRHAVTEARRLVLDDRLHVGRASIPWDRAVGAESLGIDNVYLRVGWIEDGALRVATVPLGSALFDRGLQTRADRAVREIRLRAGASEEAANVRSRLGLARSASAAAGYFRSAPIAIVAAVFSPFTIGLATTMYVCWTLMVARSYRRDELRF